MLMKPHIVEFYFHSPLSATVAMKKMNCLQTILTRSEQFANLLLCKYSASFTSPHIPVMKSEIIEHTQPKAGQVYLDMTFGSGGHANEILKYASNNLICYFLDRDPTSLSYMQQLQAAYTSSNHKMIPLIGRFSDLPQLLNKFGLTHSSVDLILMDLGVSSPQLDSESRGFGFKHNAPLDMRMNQSQCVQKDSPTAAEVVNTLKAEDLSKIFSTYGEERHANRIANAIVDYRNDVGAIRSTKQLADLIRSVVSVGNRAVSRSIHPATRVFQALRIFVNDELNELCVGLQLSESLLKPGGHLAVLSFHSLEDRLVKYLFKCDGKHSTLSKYLPYQSLKSEINSKELRYEDDLYLGRSESSSSLKNKLKWSSVIGPLTPSTSEVESNPRSRSAKLRIARKA
ncbi:unnamed protein product [Heterobilharzia americana]|nr:unnamed protein product [Heterobilharzia americana]CAH8566857.1 unnamed protein product [Heterobilharzia americana]